MFNNLYLGIKFAFSYFSILPIRFHYDDNLSKKEILNVMILFLPVVGFVLGFICLIIFGFLADLGWYGALVSAIFYMMLYGFLHTEAVIDVYDAIYASHSKKDAYKVIKEPTVGAVGVLYGVSFFLLKVAGIIMLLLNQRFTEFLSIVIVSRISLIVLIMIHDFKSDFLMQVKASINYSIVLILLILSSLLSFYYLPNFLLLLIISLILSFFISIYYASKLKFFNGDTLGATLEVVELLLFLGVNIVYHVIIKA